VNFEDLTPYSYLRAAVRPGLLNVGWLGASHDFKTADPAPEFLQALWRYCSYRVAQTRGFHTCELCVAPPQSPTSVTFNDETVRLGTAEIRVFGAGGQAFAAPDLIFHYVVTHRYPPPDSFVASVLSGPHPGTQKYDHLLSDYR